MSLLRRALRTVGLRFGKDRYLAGTDLEGESTFKILKLDDISVNEYKLGLVAHRQFIL